MTKKIYRIRKYIRITLKNMNTNSRDALLRLKMASISTPIYIKIKEASQAASMNSRSFYFKTLPQASRSFYELPEDSVRFQMVLRASRRF
jgi:hypothetical protein